MVPASESTRKEYAARMHRVVDYFQAHLSEPLDLDRIAAVACFSSFHFHRLFAAWMGETLQTFVQRLRLERAAQTLVFDRTKSVSEIALDSGFASAGTFARAFKGAFRMAASEYRKNNKCLPDSNPGEAGEWELLSFSKASGPTARNKENSMTRPRLRHIGPYKGDTALFRRLFEKLFAWAGPRGLMVPGMRYLSVMQDNPNLTPAAKQRLEVALIVPPEPVRMATSASEPFKAAFMRQRRSMYLSRNTPRNGTRCWRIGCPEADTSPITAPLWSFI